MDAYAYKKETKRILAEAALASLLAALIVAGLADADAHAITELEPQP